jgi:osmoprotectant transport system ATP-binding protein
MSENTADGPVRPVDESAQAAASATALQAQDVSLRYGATVALHAVSLAVAAGECVALVGESGSGKTTLLRCFNRMVEPATGTVRVKGRDVAQTDKVALRRRIGYVPQEGGLLPHWSALRNAGLVPWLQHSPDPAASARAALDLVGLDAATFGERKPSELSGGQRQRVAIARALAAQPDIILLDEPFGALDAITRSDLQNTFLELRARLRFTALFVTHDLTEAALLADRIAVLRAGRIEQIAPPVTLMHQPATPYVHELLARARLTR